jgi:hypothetical protein
MKMMRGRLVRLCDSLLCLWRPELNPLGATELTEDTSFATGVIMQTRHSTLLREIETQASYRASTRGRRNGIREERGVEEMVESSREERWSEGIIESVSLLSRDAEIITLSLGNDWLSLTQL